MADNKKEVILEIKVESEEALKNASAARQRLEELKEAKKEVDKQFKAGEISMKEYAERMVLIDQNTKKTKDALRAYTREIETNEGSLVQMRNKLKELLKSYDNLSAAERNAAKGDELLKQIQQLTKEVSAAEQASGRFQRNVGNYPSAFEGAGGAMEQFGGILGKIFGNNSFVGKAATTIAGFGKSVTDAGKTMTDAAGDAAKFGDAVAGASKNASGFANTTAQAATATKNVGDAAEASRAHVGGFAQGMKGAAAAEGAAATSAEAATAATFNLGNTLKIAAQYVKVFAKQLLALLATPIVATIAAIVVVFKALADAFKKNDDAMTALQSAMAAFKPLLDIIKTGLEAVVGVLTKVVNGFSSMVQAITNAIPFLRDYAKAEEDLVRATDSLQDREREYTVSHSKNALEVAKLTNQSKESEKYSYKERKGFIEEAIKLEKADMDARRVIAKEKLRLSKIEAQLNKDTSDETKNQIAELEAAVNDAEREYYEGTRRLNQQLNTFIKDERKARADAAKNAAATRKAAQDKERSEIRKQQELTLAIMIDGLEKQRATINAKYDNQIEDLKRRLQTEKELTIAARKAINAQIIILDAMRVQEQGDLNLQEAMKRIAVEKEVAEARIKLATAGSAEAVEAAKKVADVEQKVALDALTERLAKEEIEEEQSKALRAAIEKAHADKLAQIDRDAANKQREVLKSVTMSYENDLAEQLEMVADNEQAKLRIQRDAALRRQADVKAEYDRLQELGSSNNWQSEYADIEAYRQAVQAARKNIIEANAEVIASNKAVEESEREMAKAVAEAQRDLASNIADLAGVMKDFADAQSENVDLTAEQQQRYQQFALAAAIAQTLTSNAVAMAKAIEGATAAAAATGPAAPFTLAAYIAEMVGTIGASIASVKQLINQARQATSAVGYATGGYVEGTAKDRGKVDSVSAWLTEGEYVIKKDKVKLYGREFFDAINGGATSIAPRTRYADGGIVNVDARMNADATRQFAEAVKEAVADITPVVSVREITATQNKIKAKEQIARR